MIKEFKSFLLRGHVVELAVGVIIGAAFNQIVSSLIGDVITPLLLKPALDAARLSQLEHLTIFGSVRYGVFLASVLNFIIVAFILFLVIKGVNTTLKKTEDAAPPKTEPEDIALLKEIRDELRKRSN
ncbi:MAG: large conductance mechanosensitive channel protein MscL [Bacteroidetes bacterium]|nr:large conductance mechanosensitive channel protein MscL [Bacteroidota bacterium]